MPADSALRQESLQSTVNGRDSRLSVIIPVYNDSGNLAICARALAASSRRPDETLVVDDGSNQPLLDLPPALGASVTRLDGGPRGSFVARNVAAEMASGDILVFVDADVRVHPESLAQIERYLLEHPHVAAAFGSYDDEPSARQWVSRYKNLTHHYVHQQAHRQARTFWTGFGAIRALAFAAVGGFGTDERTVRDIDMGNRLRAGGFEIHLCPELQVTHLKRWTFQSMVRSDIVDRAIPWSRLIAREGQIPNDLNLGNASRWSAALAWGSIFLLVAAAMQPWALLGVCACWLTIAALNLDYYRFLARHGNALFAIGGVLLHTLYLLYSSATFALVMAAERMRRPGHPDHTHTKSEGAA